MERQASNMERMGDILARTARARANRGRLDSSSRASAPARRVMPRPAPATRPLAPDALPLDSERILELPGRGPHPQPLSLKERGAAYSPLASAEERGPGGEAVRRRESHGMLALGDAAEGYAASLRAAFPTPAPTPAAGAPRDRGRSLASDVCPICHGAGFVRDDVPVGDPSFGQAVPCVCKERALEERRRADLRRMSSLDAFLDKTFDTFDTSIPGLREAYEVARRYAEDPQGWLVLSGGYGAGKTHLAAAIASERLAAGQSVFFSITPDLLDHLRATYAPTSEVPYDELFDKVREAGLLALDDLGAENGTAWATEKLFQIINYRYNYRMPTVITTNHRLLSHMDERIRSRLADISFVRQVMIDVPDYRERHTGARRSPGGGGGAPRNGRGGYHPR